MKVVVGLLIFLLSAIVVGAQPCLTNADTDCNGVLEVNELSNYISLWYKCSSCHPDIYNVVSTFLGQPEIYARDTSDCESRPYGDVGISDTGAAYGSGNYCGHGIY